MSLASSVEELRRYFSPFVGSPWRWSADGTVLVSVDGTTLAFRNEVLEIARRIPPDRLPRFGSLVLLLMACNSSWREKADLRGHVVGLLKFNLGEDSNAIVELLKPIDSISNLSAKQRKGVDAKSLLSQFVFETIQTSFRADTAQALLQSLEQGLPPEWLEPRMGRADVELLEDLRALNGAASVTEESLDRFAATGLEQPLKPAELELPDSLRVRNLLASLSSDDDSDIACLARLALNLMAAIHIPRTLTHDEDMPLGGYTDVVNRGSLDRLLMSELAHDDMTLSVRVALNEALYLRRESPPQNPWSERTVLIDVGIRMWGLPRIYAIASALAFAASATPRTKVHVFYASESTLKPVDLKTREGLVACLSALEPEPHPGAALSNWLKSDSLESTHTERTLITHPDVLSDPDFRRNLPATADLFIATVNGNGMFELVEAGILGSKHLCSAQLDVDAVTSAPLKRPVKQPALDHTLPLALSVDPFPLRIPHRITAEHSVVVNKSMLYAVTKDGRLTWWPDPRVAPKTISTAVPFGQVLKVLTHNETILVLINQQKTNQLVLFGWDLQKQKSAELVLETHGGLPKHVELSGDTLGLIFSNRILAYDIHSGKTLHVSHPNVTWSCGRYFSKDLMYFVTDYSPGTLILRGVNTKPLRHVIALIDRESIDGPWALNESGELTSLASNEKIVFQDVGRLFQVEAVSQDGNRIKVINLERKKFMLDAIRKKAYELRHDRPVVLEPHTYQFIQLSIRSNATSIAMMGSGEFVLYGKKNSATKLEFTPRKRMVLSNSPTQPTLATPRVSFKLVKQKKGTRYKLSVAEFPGGNRVFLDSHGVLHLVPGGADPQISLVLHDEHITGWRSDGRTNSSTYFAHDGTTLSDDEMFASVRKFGKDCI